MSTARFSRILSIFAWANLVDHRASSSSSHLCLLHCSLSQDTHPNGDALFSCFLLLISCTMHSTATLKLCLLVAALMTFFLKKKRFSFFLTLLPECWFPFDTLLTQRICFPHQSRAQAVSHVARHPILKFCPCFCHWQLHLWLQAASSLGTFNFFLFHVSFFCHVTVHARASRGEVRYSLTSSIHSTLCFPNADHTK